MVARRSTSGFSSTSNSAVTEVPDGSAEALDVVAPASERCEATASSSKTMSSVALAATGGREPPSGRSTSGMSTETRSSGVSSSIAASASRRSVRGGAAGAAKCWISAAPRSSASARATTMSKSVAGARVIDSATAAGTKSAVTFAAARGAASACACCGGTGCGTGGGAAIGALGAAMPLALPPAMASTSRAFSRFASGSGFASATSTCFLSSAVAGAGSDFGTSTGGAASAMRAGAAAAGCFAGTCRATTFEGRSIFVRSNSARVSTCNARYTEPISRITEAATRMLNEIERENRSRSFRTSRRRCCGMSLLIRSARPAGGFGIGAIASFRCRSAFRFGLMLVVPHRATSRESKTPCAAACGWPPW